MAEMQPEGVDKDDLDAKKIKPPDRKKYLEDLEAISNELKAKESQHKTVSPRGADSFMLQLRKIKSEKDVLFQNQKALDPDIKALNQEIQKRDSNLARIDTGLQYRNEDTINEIIRRLEHQLKTTNYELKEEKRIVAEIDRLKRSKKSLVQYQLEKKEIDGLREQRKKLKDERDICHRKLLSLRNQEDQLKRNTRDRREKSELIKKELNELYEKKRQLQNEFYEEERRYKDLINKIRKKKEEDSRQRREEERHQQQQMLQQEIAEYEASREPYEDEKQLCRTLSAYLQRYLVDEADGPQRSPRFSQESNTGDEELAPSGDKTEPEGMKVLKKKDDLDLFCGVKPKVSKKRKEKKKAVNKVVHTPEVLAQFLQIGLQAPSSVPNVPTVIKQLEEKLKYYSSLPPPQQTMIQVNGSSKPITGEGAQEGGSEGSGGASSFTESAISDPNTPDIQNDIPPNFDGRLCSSSCIDELWPQPRRISHDSGAELEEDHVVNEQGDLKSKDNCNINKDLRKLNLSDVNSDTTVDEPDRQSDNNAIEPKLSTDFVNGPLNNDTIDSLQNAVDFKTTVDEQNSTVAQAAS